VLTLPSWSLLSMPRWRVHVINLVAAPRLVRHDLNIDLAACAAGCAIVECASQATRIRRSRQSSVFVAHAELQVVCLGTSWPRPAASVTCLRVMSFAGNVYCRRRNTKRCCCAGWRGISQGCHLGPCGRLAAVRCPADLVFRRCRRRVQRLTVMLQLFCPGTCHGTVKCLSAGAIRCLPSESVHLTPASGRHTPASGGHAAPRGRRACHHCFHRWQCNWCAPPFTASALCLRG